MECVPDVFVLYVTGQIFENKPTPQKFSVTVGDPLNKGPLIGGSTVTAVL